MTTQTIPGMRAPNEDLYDDVRGLPQLMQTAIREALASPDDAETIIEHATNEARKLSRLVEMSLRQAWLRAEKNGNAMDRAQKRADQYVKASLGRAMERALTPRCQRCDTPPGREFDPHGYFVYQLWSEDKKTPVYVGQSENLMARLGSHMSNPDRRWRVRRISITRCRDKTEMDELEMKLIKEIQPPWNIAGKEALRDYR